MCTNASQTTCCRVAAVVLALCVVVVAVFGFGCLAGTAVDEQVLEAARNFDERLRFRGAATAALGAAVAVALTATWSVWRCCGYCCCDSGDEPPTGALPLAQSDLEAGDDGPAPGKARCCASVPVHRFPQGICRLARLYDFA